MSTINAAASPDHPITIKIALNNGENRRFKLALKELGANTLPDKLRSLLAISPTQHVVFERFSDSAGSYITLDSNNPAVYKQLYRAAKAKLKLRIKATVTDTPSSKPTTPVDEPVAIDRLYSHRYVPPMNPDPLQVSAAKSPNSDMSSQHTAPAAATPVAHAAVTDMHRRAYVQKLRSSNVRHISNPLPKADAPKVEGITKGIKEEPLEEGDGEAPLPGFFSARQHFYAEIESMAGDRRNTLSSPDQAFTVPGVAFTICCNNCDAGIPDAHWHCSICDNGDFDLCGKCVDKGVLCDVDDHWLIKRIVKDGKVINSTTETIAPKKHAKVEDENDVPGAFNHNTKEEGLQESPDMSRTCNSCVQVFDESNFVTCTVCDDYDLCIPCHVSLKHGHHPGHTFLPATEDTSLDNMATRLCAPGRNIRHFAVCDGCEKYIYGVRHKCTNCPDWDYCPTCFEGARQNHPGHRFVPLYEPIPQMPQMPQRTQRHLGINCDGPLCKDKQYGSYITGVRYKCAVCHDTDFCANCEALPTLRHNRTHPLIKFKTPVRNVSVTTLGEKLNGEQTCAMGDQLPQTSSKATETTPPAASTNAATQVQTIAEVKPTESEPAKEPKTKFQNPVIPGLQAHFIRDAVPDGSVFAPSVQFEQVWTLRNPGPYAWPAGCSVRFIGGDIMFNVDPNRPSSVSDIVKSTESNVIDRVVEVGEEIDFNVTMRTPEREGKAISYWRLKAADGLPFGHKLWCDINVCFPEGTEVMTKTVEGVSKPEEVEEGIKTEHIEDIAKIVKHEGPEHSQMIFPKLEKESPVSSTHEAQAAPVPATEVEHQLQEDLETLTLEDESASDNGFLTDEEYEMLEASDDEWMEAKNGKK